MAKLTSSFSRTNSSSFPENISSSIFFWLNFRNLMLAKPRAVRSVTPTRRRYENTSRPFTAPVRKKQKKSSFKNFFWVQKCWDWLWWESWPTRLQRLKFEALQLNPMDRKIFKVWVSKKNWGSGCGTVGRAVASDTRDPRFESQHRQKFICQLHYMEKAKIKQTRPGKAHLKKTRLDICLRHRRGSSHRCFLC